MSETSFRRVCTCGCETSSRCLPPRALTSVRAGRTRSLIILSRCRCCSLLLQTPALWQRSRAHSVSSVGVHLVNERKLLTSASSFAAKSTRMIQALILHHSFTNFDLVTAIQFESMSMHSKTISPLREDVVKSETRHLAPRRLFHHPGRPRHASRYGATAAAMAS